jgi:hypothetical protein
MIVPEHVILPGMRDAGPLSGLGCLARLSGCGVKPIRGALTPRQNTNTNDAERA